MQGRYNTGVENDAFQMHENGNIPEKNHRKSIENPPKRKKSIVQLTLEVLPRLENYRNSKRAVKRPSLGELHGADDYIKEPKGPSDSDENITGGHEWVKLGWIQGVLIPCLLNIFGVMLFLRLPWIVAEAGIGYSLLIIAISAVVCVITTLSLSAICTNGEVKGGGIYYIISRSLGPEFGASVGIVFAFANAVSASMNTIGFCNSLSELVTIFDDGDKNHTNDARIVGIIALFVMILICAVGMDWESKAQNFLLVVIVGAMVDFVAGTIVGSVVGTTEEEKKVGFVGFDVDTFRNNWSPQYRKTDGMDFNFIQVFAMFFPSVTGIQAGANISGDLKDPASAIPKGTFLALLISMTSYATFVILAGAAAVRDAGCEILTENGINFTNIDNCTNGLYHDYQIMQKMSSWAPFIYAGCWAATLSTALTNLLSVPRLIQALGVDKIYPGLIFFSKGYGKHGEPYRGYVLTFIVSAAFLLIANLNAVAPLISNFYLASYALINFCTFHAALIKPLGWRPTFKYYNTWLSLFGFIICIVIMFLINWMSSLITFIVILGLYLLVVYRKPDVNWGSSTQAQTYKTALATTQRLINIGEHVKNYKPQILVLCGVPNARPPLVDFANLITKNHSLLIVGDVTDKQLPHKRRAVRINSSYDYLKSNKIKAFYTVIDSTCFENGAKALLQTTGIGKLSPNVLMMGYKNDWITCKTSDLVSYFNVLHAAFDHHMAVAILRLKEGLDYTSLIKIDEETVNGIATPISSVKLRTSQSSAILHVDSNLSLDKLANFVPSTDVKYKSAMNATKEMKQKKNKALEAILSVSSNELATIEKMNRFRRKQTKGFIDVWWLYDDGGLTMLLPYIISTRQDWSNCKLRVFALANNNLELETEERNMANLLSKFRLEYSSLKMVWISEKPQDSTIKFFNDIISEYKANKNENECQLTDLEIQSCQDKTYRQLRLRELLLENSVNSNLVVMSLPMPRKSTVSAQLYMAWLEVLTRDMPPYLLVRGNQQSVLTFYS